MYTKIANGFAHKERVQKFRKPGIGGDFEKITVLGECFLACKVIRTAILKIHLRSDQDVLEEIQIIPFSGS